MAKTKDLNLRGYRVSNCESQWLGIIKNIIVHIIRRTKERLIYKIKSALQGISLKSFNCWEISVWSAEKLTGKFFKSTTLKGEEQRIEQIEETQDTKESLEKSGKGRRNTNSSVQAVIGGRKSTSKKERRSIKTNPQFLKSGKQSKKVKKTSHGKEKLFHFGRGNRKLSSKQLVWSLPRGSTCIGAGSCLKYCYAKKAETAYKNVLPSRLRNLEFTMTEQFVSSIVDFIKRSKKQIVRIHEAGDFYNQLYLDNWKEIACQLPDVIFYAFTKSYALLDFWTNLPDNFVVLQSYGSRFDDKIDPTRNTARVIENVTELRKTEYLCPYHEENFTKCGECCDYCYNHKGVKRVAFLKH